MERVELVNRLRTYLERASCEFLTFADVPGLEESWDLSFDIPTGHAFLCVVAQGESLDIIWYRAQSQIALLRDTRYEHGWLPDLYLVLVLEDTHQAVSLAAQAITQDPYICRKVALPWDEDVDALFQRMPFWTLTLPEARLPIVPSVTETMGHLGYVPDFVKALPDTSAETLVQKLQNQTLRVKVDGQRLQDSTVIPATERVGGSTQHRRLKSMTVEGFRAFPHLQPFQFDGDLIAVYAPNGTGKTSLCEAIEWVLTGNVKRVGKAGADAPEDSRTPLLHAEADSARVVLTESIGIRDQTVEAHAANGAIRWSVNGVERSDKWSIRQTLGVVLPEDQSAIWIRDAFRRYHFLPQQEPEILSDKPTKRYDMIQVLVGTMEYQKAAQRMDEVLRLLERSKKIQEDNLAAERLHAQALRQDVSLQRSGVDDQLAALAGLDPEELLAGVRQDALTLKLLDEASDSVAVQPDVLAAVLTEKSVLAIIDTEQLLQDLGGLPLQLADRMKWKNQVGVIKANAAALELEQDNLTGERQKLLQQIDDRSDEEERLQTAWESKTQRVGLLRRHLELLSKLSSARAEEKQLGDEARKAEEALGEARNQVTDAEGEYQRRASQLAKVMAECDGERRRLQQIAKVQQSLEAWHLLSGRLAEVVGLTSGLESTIRDLNAKLTDTLRDGKDLRSEADKVASEVAGLQQTLSERQKLLVALQAHIDSDHCPLCRSGFPDKDALKAAVRTSLEVIPPALATARGRKKELDENLQKTKMRYEALKKQKEDVEGELKTLADEREKLNYKIQETEGVIRAELGPIPLDAAAEELGRRTKVVQQKLDASESLRHDLESALIPIAARVAGLRSELEAHEETWRLADRKMGFARSAQAGLEAEDAELHLTDQERENPEQTLGELLSNLTTLPDRLESIRIRLKASREAVSHDTA